MMRVMESTGILHTAHIIQSIMGKYVAVFLLGGQL